MYDFFVYLQALGAPCSRLNLVFIGNALNPLAFPALKLMETEIVTMALRLLNAPESARGRHSYSISFALLIFTLSNLCLLIFE